MNKGFTIIETLVSMVLISVLAGGIFMLVQALRDNQASTWQNYLNVDQANSSMTVLIREIRTARNGDNGVYTFDTMDDNEIVFYSDIDYDEQAERVRYFLDGNEFSKGVIEPEGTPATYPSENETVKLLTDNVRNLTEPVFYYYNADWPNDTAGNPLPPGQRVSDTRLIRAYLRINTLENDPGSDYVLESYAQTRMLKDNL